MVVFSANTISMAFHDDEEKEKDGETLTDDAIGEVLDEDADEDEVPAVPPEEDEKAWE